MDIICTPSHGILALIIDPVAGSVLHEAAMPAEMHGRRNRPFGIARDPSGNWYIACNNAVAFLDSHLRFQRLLTDLPEDIHQLCYEPVSQELWAVATSIDSLLAIDPKNNKVRRFCLLTDKWVPLDAPGEDTYHFNSISWYGDHFHVVAHKLGQTSSFVRTYNRQMRRISLWQAGRESHVALEYKNQLVLLDSRGGRIVSNGGIDIKICEPNQYARGMVISPDGIAIIAVFEFSNRDNRHTGDAYLGSFDLESGRKVREMELKGTGNINDIQWWKTA